MKNGLFIISLDFELHWGVFDALKLEDYKNNLLKVPEVVERLLELAKKYDINLTFATVGLLFNQNKTELLNSLPNAKPIYENKDLSSYKLLSLIGDSEEDDKIHYAKSLINLIKSNPKHELASHTFSHYYCCEEGQNIQSFEADLIAFKKVAESNRVKVSSIVFPKNQINKDYLDLCYFHGIKTYRGSEKSFLYKTRPEGKTNKLIRLLRFTDSYFNITGPNIYKHNDLYNDTIINLPSSRFLRPYCSNLKFLEKFKLRRVNNAMKRAAKSKGIYHLWWHPHNFGDNIDENFLTLELIFKKYSYLRDTYGFESVTMNIASKKVLEK